MTDDIEPGGSARAPEHGISIRRDLDDEPEAAIRNAAPDLLTPIDPSSPVSGHVPLADSGRAPASHMPEHDWPAASVVLVPILRPAGTHGLRIDEIDRATLVAHANKAHTMPLLGDGPCGLAVVYALPAAGFDVIVNGEHILSWGVEPEAVHDAALANLAAWSAGADWSDESSGGRRLISSDTGAGWDAARILLPEVRQFLEGKLRIEPQARVLIGLPDRHLLMAGALLPGDAEFAVLFHDYVAEHGDGADEPIDRRVFELVGSELVEFSA